MIPEPFQPWFAPKHALVRQLMYLCISNPGVIFFSDPTGKVWFVRQQNKPACIYLQKPHMLRLLGHLLSSAMTDF